MSDLEIRPFGPDDADHVSSALLLRNAVSAVDSPWEPPELPEHFDAMLRHGWDGEPASHFLLRVGGEPLGVGSVMLPTRENTHIGWVDVAVAPAHRRQGYGRALFDRMVEEVTSAGRRLVTTDGWESDASVGFAASVGLERKAQEIMRRQHLTELEPAVLDGLVAQAAAAAADYELLRIAGRTPSDLVEDVAVLSAAINDAPTDDLDIEDDVMSPERLAAYEDAVEARGNRIYRLLARHRVSGALGGHTVIAVDSHRPTLAHQHDTAVAREHRGHRLGLLLKAAMVQWLAEVEPQIETIDTWNAESNDHMIGVNRSLGYQVMGRALEFQKSV